MQGECYSDDSENSEGGTDICKAQILNFKAEPRTLAQLAISWSLRRGYQFGSSSELTGIMGKFIDCFRWCVNIALAYSCFLSNGDFHSVERRKAKSFSKK